jgi:uncharacterized protein YbaR (Trm112 family)
LEYDVLNMFKCPVCSGQALEFIQLPDREGFRNAGALVCEDCRELFIVHEGIISLVKPDYADKEREAAFINAYIWDLPSASAGKRLEAISSRTEDENNKV